MTDVDLSSPAAYERAEELRAPRALAPRPTAASERRSRANGHSRLPELVAEAGGLGLCRIDIRIRRRRDALQGSDLDLALHRVAAAWAEAGLDVVLRDTRTRGHSPDAVVEVSDTVPALGARWSRRPTIFLVDPPRADRSWSHEAPPEGLRHAVATRWASPVHGRRRVIAGSPSARDRIVSRLGCHPSNVQVVASGIDRRFAPGGRRAGEPLVVASGQLVPDERFDVLVELLVDAKRFVPRLQAVIVGEGPCREELDRAITRAGAEDWLRLSGPLSDPELATAYRRAWVVVSTALHGGWGIRLPDAAACGTPAVASNVADHQACVVHEVSGLLADPGHELVAGLVRVLTDGVLRDRLGRGALIGSHDRTWDACAAGILQALVAEARSRR